MRALLLPATLAAALAACGEARSPGEAAAAEPLLLLGQYSAASESARAITGDVGVERAGLIFSRGQVLYTRALASRSGAEMTAQGGDSYAAIAHGPPDMTVELRRVIDAVDAAGLCEAGMPTYVALVHDGDGDAIALLVFAGEEPPGPRATQSRLCARFAYRATGGAGRREGVVLR